jgi:hypothetical protein
MRPKNFFLLLFILQLSCNDYWDTSKSMSDLMKKDYSIYSGLSLFIYSFDEQDHPIIYMQFFPYSLKNCGEKQFVVNISDSSVLEAGIRNFSDTCHLVMSSTDSVLAVNFALLKIRRLMVDNNENVFISTGSFEHFNLVKLAQYNDSSNKYDKWTPLGKNWFQKP